MQTASVGEYIRHSNGLNGKVVNLSPDGLIAEVHVLATSKRDDWPLSLCESDNDSPRLKQADVLVRVAKGPIVGAILIAHLITAAITLVVLLIMGVIR